MLYIIIGRSSCIGSGMCGLNYHNHLIIYSYCPLKKLEPPNFYSFFGGGGGGNDAIFQNLTNGLHSYKLRNSGNSWVRGFSFSDGLMYSSQLKLINMCRRIDYSVLGNLFNNVLNVCLLSLPHFHPHPYCAMNN